MAARGDLYVRKGQEVPAPLRAGCVPVFSPKWATFIADGAHIPFVALRNYLRLLPLDRCAIVTDSIAPAGLGPGRYTLGRWDIVVGDDMVPRSPDGSHFVGSGVTMRHSAQNLLEHVHLTEDAVRRLTYDNPKAFLHIN